jgi:ubiquinone/menaquinone biosynthesis C-methylase UbiE
MDVDHNMYRHFANVASNYRAVRTTDIEPIEFIAGKLSHLSELTAADVGCGCGRYDALLFSYLNGLHLTCVDINQSMLEEASYHLTDHQITHFQTVRANANEIPLEKNSLDCIFTFNAVHHFDFVEFIKKALSAIKDDGWIFIYTRTKNQNAKNIWGQYFPRFSEKEYRLYTLNEMQQWINSVGGLTLKYYKRFKYNRIAKFEELINRVNARHYSTFSLFQEHELDQALKGFKNKILKRFKNTKRIEWIDENIMLVLKPAA